MPCVAIEVRVSAHRLCNGIHMTGLMWKAPTLSRVRLSCALPALLSKLKFHVDGNTDSEPLSKVAVSATRLSLTIIAKVHTDGNAGSLEHWLPFSPRLQALPCHWGLTRRTDCNNLHIKPSELIINPKPSTWDVLAGPAVEGKTLGQTVQDQKDAADDERFMDDRQPLHEVRWGCPVTYQAKPSFFPMPNLAAGHENAPVKRGIPSAPGLNVLLSC